MLAGSCCWCRSSAAPRRAAAAGSVSSVRSSQQPTASRRPGLLRPGCASTTARRPRPQTALCHSACPTHTHTTLPPRSDEELWLSEVADVLEVPKAMRERQGALLHMDGLPPGMATDMIGMGTWRLRSEWGLAAVCGDLIVPVPAFQNVGGRAAARRET